MKDLDQKVKWVALALTAGVVLSALAGCSATNGTPGSTSSSSTGVTTVTGTTLNSTAGTTSSRAAAVSTASSVAIEFKSDDLDASFNTSSSTLVQLNGNSAAVTGSGASVSGGSVTISAAGTYVVSGKLDNGQIIVTVTDKDLVRLVLNGAEITSKTGPAIQVDDAKRVVLVLADGTINKVADAGSYAHLDNATNEPNAAIFSKADLTVNGKGSLAVDANFAHGIVSKDDLKIVSGSITIDSIGDGLKGLDLVAIKDGTVTIQAEGDGIQSTNADDADKGNVVIDGGTVTISSGLDGLQAEKVVQINDGTIKITAGGGNTKGTQTAADSGWRPGMTAPTTAINEASKKGIKGLTQVTVLEGAITVDSADDAIHSNGQIAIGGGILNLTSGDDGIHADTSIIINAGDIQIAKSYEGIESTTVRINGGQVQVVASDDGINIGGGADGSAMGGRPGQNTFNTNNSASLDITGGSISINANGDGVDSNGSITMSDGVLLVNGPTNNGNGALDFNTFKMTGGFLVAAGSSGMAQAPDSPSTQYSIIANFPASLAASTLVNVSSTSGESIVTFAPSKTFQSFVVSSPNLKKGASYVISTGGSASGTNANGLFTGGAYQGGTAVATVSISSILTRYGTTGGMGGGPGGMGGTGGGRR